METWTTKSNFLLNFETYPNTQGNGRFLKRTIVEKNGESTVRTLVRLQPMFRGSLRVQLLSRPQNLPKGELALSPFGLPFLVMAPKSWPSPKWGLHPKKVSSGNSWFLGSRLNLWSNLLPSEWAKQKLNHQKAESLGQVK